MPFHSALVVNETQLPELIQKETHASARGADHVGERILADLRYDRLRLAFFPMNAMPSDPATGLLTFLSGRSPTTVSVFVREVG